MPGIQPRLLVSDAVMAMLQIRLNHVIDKQMKLS
jgi:hypothetical protein